MDKTFVRAPPLAVCQRRGGSWIVHAWQSFGDEDDSKEEPAYLYRKLPHARLLQLMVIQVIRAPIMGLSKLVSVFASNTAAIVA